MSDKLRFDTGRYEVKTCELDGRSITYRAFEGIDYCANPVDPIQKLNLFVPGDVERIVTNGTSAGGALSALAGATGNSPDYVPYLAAIGAADERDDIFAASCYCPIHNLEHADAAYEWLFSGCNEYNIPTFAKVDGKVRRTTMTGQLTEKQIALSKELKKLFPAYLNGLHLTDRAGNLLTLDENGEGSFR